jgi:dienelactone hydrolase
MGLPFINKDKIALVGWGLSGASSLIAIDDNSKIQNRGTNFSAAVAFYPFPAQEIRKQNAPLLVLVGEKDGVASAVALRTLLSLSKSQHEINLKIYKNATHCFDWEGFSGGTGVGASKQEYNPGAARAAILEVQKFLSKYLK